MTQWFLITPGHKQTLIFKSGLLTSYCIDWEVFYIFFCLKEGTRKKALSSARGDWCTHDIHDVVQKGHQLYLLYHWYRFNAAFTFSALLCSVEQVKYTKCYNCTMKIGVLRGRLPWLPARLLIPWWWFSCFQVLVSQQCLSLCSDSLVHFQSSF